ncbi:MAG: hypothetical protein JWP57_3520 [Spirosoma sp.]|nr:hypothetical protein [Spirosoma sp.]
MNGLWTSGCIVIALFGGRVLAQPGKAVDGPLTGLKGEYFNGPNFDKKVFSRVDPQVAFDWNWQYPAPGVQREYFSVRWTGQIYAPVSGKYQFSATADDGVRVWVGGKKIIDEWRKQDDSQFVGEITLNARQSYPIKVEYYNDWKGSIIYLFWKIPNARLVSQRYRSATQTFDIIPAHYLSAKLTRPVALSLGVRKPVVKAVPGQVVTVADKVRSTVMTPPIEAKQTVGSIKPIAPRAMVDPSPKTPESFARLVAGETVVLHHVFFRQSEYALLDTSYRELNKLLRALQAQPAMQIEVGGHTDNVGDSRLKLALSENRAKVVAQYLIRHGISEQRIEAKGYGSTHPIADNADEEGRTKNRRVEITVR